MRKKLGLVVVAAVVGWFGAPVQASGGTDESVAPVAVQRVSVPSSGVPEQAAMVLVGTALIGLAAAMRRAA